MLVRQQMWGGAMFNKLPADLDLKLEEVRETYLTAHEMRFDFTARDVHSQGLNHIETLMYMALWQHLNLWHLCEVPIVPRFKLGAPRQETRHATPNLLHFILYAQAPVGRYKADILLDVLRGKKREIVVVECDGHDFHERTKQQAAHDRSRDRWMAAKGIIVIRFTGSEIWKSPIACVEQVSDILRARMQ